MPSESCRRRLELESQAVHAVPQASWLRTIREDVTQVPLAAVAPHLQSWNNTA